MAKPRVSLIGVPLDLGAGRRGVDMGPSALRVAGLEEKIRGLGYDVRDHGDLSVKIQETCEQLRETVRGVLGEGRMPVVLGGDHSIAMGTIAGVSTHFHERGEKV